MVYEKQLSGIKIMNKLIFGFDQFKEDGDPIPNLETFEFDDKKICNCGNVFLGMLQDIKFNYQETATRQWEDLSMETLPIDNIKNNYIYHIDVNCFAWAFGYNRWPRTFEDESLFDSISDKVIGDIQSGKCKLLVNYGYEGLGSHHRDSILDEPLLERIHFILKKYKIPQESFIYMDSNNTYADIELDTKINIIQYEYCALDQWRFTKQNPKMMYHGNTKSSKNMKRWSNSKDKIRKKHYLSFNRLPKDHRVKLVVSLDKHNLLDKGYVSFANKITDWDWKKMVTKEEQLSLEKEMPLVIDNPDLSLCKHSYDVFDVRYFLDSYFQIVTGNNFTDWTDQLIFSEKIWKPITNLQPFIYLDDVGALKKLHEYGFKTFEPFIDESYDRVYNTEERFSMIEGEIIKLCNKPIEEIHEWYWSIEDVIKHNYYHFYEKFIPDMKSKMINELEELL
jgi:hypothetical protein|tara:strand:- start:2405 stop:3754 length:1350 start_codon:yes stop_codon:yes gene_type:complete